MKLEPMDGLTKLVKNELMGGPAEMRSNRYSSTVMAPQVVDAMWLKSLPPLNYESVHDGVDGVDDGGFDGVEWWRRMVGTGVFDTEGTDVEVPLCPQ